MSEKTKRPANFADLEAVPDHLVAQLIDGELIVMPRPASPHAVAQSVLGALLLTTFQLGQRGPGGWWIVDEPELHFGNDAVIPDLAGWRRERLPQMPRVPYHTLAPDWICEVLSPSTETLDRKRKRELYAREGVEHVWLVDPDSRTLEVFRRQGDTWEPRGTYAGETRVRAEPFEAMELDLGALWPPELEVP
ncbi:Uma2 family endonuclease [Pyxidicoccus xibeiensis]|uniref:Uma2 family endonuclease n=1 Tax=Pyxidicoccus xibeiensis TaxID=2906759 RepID=UPI0020A771B0|nr:Uma2 family endonuclease [Pyxidicoccus xibeiensis]MCP3138728.1 Uma2 family endonuclease [Pyxidicoccus xibeiensis]